MKKICIVAPIHPYNDVRIFQKEAKSLQQKGYRIIIFAQAERNKLKDGIQIKKAPIYSSRLKRFLLQPILLIKLLRLNGDIYHLHNPDMLLIGFCLKFIGKKVVYDTHEDFSKRILMREWIPALFRKCVAKFVDKLERKAAKYFDGFIVTQIHQKDKFGKKTILLENPPLVKSSAIDEAYEISGIISKDPNLIRLIYVGSISETRGIIQLVQVMEEVNKYIHCRLWLIGSCSDHKFINFLKKMNGWNYVDYLGYLPQEKAFAYIISADVGMATILDIGDHSTTSANKLFEYQRFGLPFIASDFSKWKKDMKGIDSGLFVNPNNLNKISQAVLTLSKNRELRRRLGKNGQMFIINEFNWENESNKLLTLYENI